MIRLREWIVRTRGLVRALVGDEGAKEDAALRAELDAHLDIATEEYERRGMSPADARRRALLDAGALTEAVASVRRQRTIPSVDILVRDVRHAMRTLAAHRRYTVAVLLTLGLGIGATVSMFSMLHAVILRPLPYPEPDRIVSLSVATAAAGDMQVVDDRTVRAWMEQLRSVEALMIEAPTNALMQTPAGVVNASGLLASPSYFRVMRVQPLMGRAFAEEDAVRGAAPVMLISDAYWRSTYGGDSTVIGRMVDVDGSAVTIIGIMPTISVTSQPTQFWRPYRMAELSEDITVYYNVTARVRPDATIQSLRTELETLQRHLDPQRPESLRGLQPIAMTLHDRLFGSVRSTLLLLFAAVGVLLLITCANLANLGLARAVRRRREFAVRLALGATRWRIMRYGLTESLLLSFGGATIGVVLAMLTIGYFVRISPATVANVADIGIDRNVLLFTIAITIVATVLAGLAPAIAAGRSGVNLAIPSATARSAGSRGQRVFRRLLVVFELATALVLLLGAGLVARTFWHVTSIGFGVEPRQLSSATISLPRRTYTDTTAQVLMQQLLAQVRALPGVQSAALSNVRPLTGARMSTAIERGDGGPPVYFDVVNVTPRYFETVGTRIAEGRAIDNSVQQDGRGEVVVSASLARVVADSGGAIGRTLRIGERTLTIVGVTEEIRQRSLESEPTRVAFSSLADGGGWMRTYLLIRTDVGAAPMTPAITQLLRALDATLRPPTLTPMQRVVDSLVAPRKFVFVLLGLFASLAGILAVVGLYGVLSYVVTEQTREIGIRAALGADRWRVMRHILAQGTVLTVGGVLIGLGSAFFAATSMEKLVYGITVYDWRTFIGGTVLLVLVSLLASYLPARRASLVDPIVALRAE